MDLQRALKSAQRACQEARKIQLNHFGGPLRISDKGIEGLVSEADVKSEEAIRKVLLEEFPEIPVYGEEEVFLGKDSQLQKTSWVVDPLDGTTNFIYGLPIYCISIGLQVNDEVVLGVIDVPPWNRQYWAMRGHGAYLAKSLGAAPGGQGDHGGEESLSSAAERIRVSERKEISNAVLATGFHPGNKDSLRSQIQIFSKLVADSRAVRRAGAAALDLCLVAEGVFDAFWESDLKPWDVAAGSLIVREAGGRVSNYKGEHFDIRDKSILAASPSLYDVVIQSTNF